MYIFAKKSFKKKYKNILNKKNNGQVINRLKVVNQFMYDYFINKVYF